MPETKLIGNHKTGILEMPQKGFITVREAKAHGSVVTDLHKRLGIENVPQSEYECAIAQSFYEVRTGRDFFADYQNAALEVGLLAETLDDVPYAVLHGIYEFYHEERDAGELPKPTTGESQVGSSDTISPVSHDSELNNSWPVPAALSVKP